jgi:hypothetical protein
MVIVRTVNEAVAIQTQRQDLANHHIWSMQEMEVLLADPRMQEVIKIKALVPTAQLTSFKPTSEFKPGGATGFDDFVDDLTFSDNDVLDYKFDSKQAEKFKNGNNAACSTGLPRPAPMSNILGLSTPSLQFLMTNKNIQFIECMVSSP